MATRWLTQGVSGDGVPVATAFPATQEIARREHACALYGYNEVMYCDSIEFNVSRRMI